MYASLSARSRISAGQWPRNAAALSSESAGRIHRPQENGGSPGQSCPFLTPFLAAANSTAATAPVMRRWQPAGPATSRETLVSPHRGEGQVNQYHFLTSGHRDSESGWNASSPGIVATSL